MNYKNLQNIILAMLIIICLSGLVYNDNMMKDYKSEISEMQQTIETKSSKITTLENSIKVKDEKIKKKQQVIEQKKKKIKSLKKDNKAKDKEISKLRNKLKIYNYNKKVSDYKKAQNNVSSNTKNSHSTGYDTTMIVTAYTAGYESTQKQKGDVGYGKTASGDYVQEGVTIACPKHMPFGTVINIEGVGQRVCKDRGGAIGIGHLDLYFNSVSKAKQFGKKQLRVEIVK